MKFDSLLDYRLFIKRIENTITDKTFLLRVKGSGENEIQDADYVLLKDDVSSYMDELRLHSSKKTFYKKLLKKNLTADNVPQLYALMTHLAIGYDSRCKIRNNVDTKDFKHLRDEVNKMVTKLLNDGKTENILYDILKKNGKR